MNTVDFFTHCDDFLIDLRRRDLSLATQNAYQRDLQELRQWADKYQQFTVDGRFFIQALKYLSGRNLHPRSLARKLSVWRSYLYYLIEHHHLSENYLAGIKAPKPPSRLPKAIDAEELDRLLDAPDEDNFYTRRDAALFELLYGSGLRVAEAVGLNLSDIDLNEAWVKVHGKGDKERHVPLGRKSIEALRLYLQERPQNGEETAVFVNHYGKRISIRRVNQTLDDWAMRHQASRHISPHMLRHSFAGQMLQGSRDIRAVQELLGHSRLSTTQIYTQLDFDHLAQVYDDAHPRAKKK